MKPGLLEHRLGADAERAFVTGQDHAGEGGGAGFGQWSSPCRDVQAVAHVGAREFRRRSASGAVILVMVGVARCARAAGGFVGGAEPLRRVAAARRAAGSAATASSGTEPIDARAAGAAGRGRFARRARSARAAGPCGWRRIVVACVAAHVGAVGDGAAEPLRGSSSLVIAFSSIAVQRVAAVRGPQTAALSVLSH